MVALDDALPPAVRLCVRDRGMEDGAGANLAVELWAGNERQPRLKGEAVRVGQPGGIVLEARALAAPLLIVVQQSDPAGFVADLGCRSSASQRDGRFGSADPLRHALDV